MKRINNENLKEINGGARRASGELYYFIGGLVTFIVGLVNGYQRPLMCSSSK